MGLAERRAAKEFQAGKLPALTAEVVAAAGFAMPIEVEFEALSVAEMSHLYDEAWTKVYFTPLIAALKAITVDDLGRDALRAGLKKVVITNRAGCHYGDRMSTFEAGVLTLDHEPTTNIDDLADRITGIRKTLEAAL